MCLKRGNDEAYTHFDVRLSGGNEQFPDVLQQSRNSNTLKSRSQYFVWLCS